MVGGILGYSSKNQISYCYNIGEVRGITNVGGGIGFASGDTTKIVYYLTKKTYVNGKQIDVAHSSGNSSIIKVKTDVQFKNEVSNTVESVTYLLNNSSQTGEWVKGTENDGYPILKWQVQ